MTLLDHLGVTGTDDGSGEPIRFTPREEHANTHGTVHGGALATVLDAACGRQAREGLEDGTTVATVSLTITYLRAAKVGSRLTASTSTLHQGERLVMVEGELVDDDGKAVAHAASTFSVIDG